MVVAVPPAALDLSSLQPVHLGTYENHVHWSEDVEKFTTSFLNGNHHREVLKMLDVNQTYVQYQKVRILQEFHTSHGNKKGDNNEEFKLGMAEAQAVKELQKHCCWLVHFIDMDKLGAHPEKQWLLDHLTSNTPIVALPDDDNDRLYQVLNIIATLESAKDKDNYINEICCRAGGSSKSRLACILSDEGIYSAVTPLLRMKHFRGRKIGRADTGTGFTARQLDSWCPATGGLQILLCEYVMDVFTFLAAPIKVERLSTVKARLEKAPEGEGQGEMTEEAKSHALAKRLRAHARKLLEQAKASPYHAWEVVDENAEKWLEAWVQLSRKCGYSFPWRLWALEDPNSQKVWQDLIDQYWRRILSACTREGHQVTLDPQNNNDDRVCVDMAVKMDWIKAGLLVRKAYPKSFASLPIGNRLLFQNVQRVFSDTVSTPPIELTEVIKEVVTWVEPFLPFAMNQRGDCVWRDYTHALMDNAQCLTQSRLARVMISSLFIEQHAALGMLNTNMKAPGFVEQFTIYTPANLPPQVLAKSFLDRMENIVQAYHEQLKSWSTHAVSGTPPYLWPEPNHTVNFSELQPQQEQVARGIIEMMRVTAFPMACIQNMKMLVECLAPLALNKGPREALLMSKNAWKLRSDLGSTMAQCVGQGDKKWWWWDGIQEFPGEEDSMAELVSDDLMDLDKNETQDTKVVCATLEQQTLAANRAAIGKMVDLAFTPKLGLLPNGKVAPAVYKTGRKFILIYHTLGTDKRIRVSSESHCLAFSECIIQPLGEL